MGIYYDRKPSWQAEMLKRTQRQRRMASQRKLKEEEKIWLENMKKRGGCFPQ